MTRPLQLFVCLTTLAGAALAQTTIEPAFNRPSTTVAYIYVQTTKGVKVYDASSLGKLTEVSGSPFKTTGAMIGSNGTHFITLGTDYVHSYPVASNGAIEEQASEIDTRSYSGANCGTTRGGVLFGQDVYVALTNAAKDGAGTGVCDALQTFRVPNTGTPAFLGSTVFDTDDPFVVGTITLPVLSGNGAFAYAVEAEGHGRGYHRYVCRQQQRAGPHDLRRGNWPDCRAKPALLSHPAYGHRRKQPPCHGHVLRSDRTLWGILSPSNRQLYGGQQGRANLDEHL